MAPLPCSHWDERGFGYSGGEVAVLKPELEGRDAVALIDWIAADVDEVAREDGAPGDPVIGFSGGSYGGGIQLLAAALDDRVDALAPEITWNDLRYSRYGNGVINFGVINFGWGETLYAAGVPTARGEGLDPRNPAGPQPSGLAPEIHRAQAEGASTDQASAESLDFFGRSSLAGYGQDEGMAVRRAVRRGERRGHRDQHAGADDVRPVAVAGQLRSGGGALPPLPPVAAQPSAPGDPHAFGTEVVVADDGPVELVGIPTATVTVSGTGPAAHLFLELVDRETGEVLNLQETPLRVEDLSAQPQTSQLRMSGIAYTLPAGHHLDLQVSATSVMHAAAWTPAEAAVALEAEIPVRPMAG